MNDKKYKLLVVTPEDDNAIYYDLFDDILHLNKYCFMGNRDFNSHIATWYDDIKQAMEDTENYIEQYFEYMDEFNFADVLEGAKDFVADYKDTMEIYGITLTVSKVLSIYDYYFGFGNHKDGIKSKLYFDDIATNFKDETLDIADFLAGVSEHILRGFMQSEWLYCYYLKTDDEAERIFDNEYFSCLYFGGLYDYRVYEVDSLDIDIDDIWGEYEEYDVMTEPYTSNPQDLFDYKLDAIADVDKTVTYKKDIYRVTEL